MIFNYQHDKMTNFLKKLFSRKTKSVKTQPDADTVKWKQIVEESLQEFDEAVKSTDIEKDLFRIIHGREMPMDMYYRILERKLTT